MLNEFATKEVKTVIIDDSYSSLFALEFLQSHKLHLEDMAPLTRPEFSFVSYYNVDLNPPYYEKISGSRPEIYLRKTLIDKLKEINRILSKNGIELFIFDGYRSPRLQNYFYNVWVPNELSKRFPDKSQTWIMQERNKYWSKGADSMQELLLKIPPHSTGGAVDLTIRFKETHIPLEMGTIFDDTSSKSHTAYFEKTCDPESFTELEARKNRRILFNVMDKYGFANHPHEWWHYSYGDQMWAYFKKESPFYSYAGDQLAEDF